MAVILSLAIATQAQDAYFTQFFSTPLEQNPALTGAIDGNFRVAATYRDQWSGLVDNSYKTFGLFGDLRFDIGQRSKDYVGGGLTFIGDKVPRYDFNTNGIKISGAFHKNLSGVSSQYLSGGLYFGLMQRNVNVEQLFFDDQFNGANGYTFSTQEVLPENNFAYLDLGLGINYAISPSDGTQFTIGGAVAHLNQPSASFGVRTDGFEVPDIDLYARWTAYVSATFELSDPVDLLPRFAFVTQGEHLLMNFGTNVRFEINQYNSNAMHLGAGLRLARDLESVAPSAVYGFAGIELGSFLIGLSYDYNLNDLVNERLGQGVLEINFTYIGEYDNSSSFCPAF